MQAAAGAILPIGMLISGPLAELLGIRELFILAIAAGFFVITIMWVFTNISSLDLAEEVNAKPDPLSVEKVSILSS